jgi:predicted oxidoreductase
MKYINLGGSEVSAPVIGLGCMRILGLDEKALEALVDGCLERGINFFDHADVYGGGKCETVFGELMARKPGLREKITIQSKCGIRRGFWDFSKEHIVGST